jgi:hypothetical protein
VRLTIDRAEQLPAAKAIIAAMYQVPDAISSLEQPQLVHALAMVEKLGVGYVMQQAMQALLNAADEPQGLSAAAWQALAGLEAWPSHLVKALPALVKHAPCCTVPAADLAALVAADASGSIRQSLVIALGDLQAGWAAAGEKAALLSLPLPAMQLLLSSDQLRVPSEDTVLYTAIQYVQAQTDDAAKAAAKAALAQLVRAPLLSELTLSCAALPADSGQQLLGTYAQQLRDLLPLKFKRNASQEQLAAALEAYEGLPPSWRLGPRQIRPLADDVQLEWRLPLEQLMQACRDSFAQQKVVHIDSPSSAPLGGVGWRMVVQCKQAEGGTVVGLFAGPVAADMPASIFFTYRCTLAWQGAHCGKRYTCTNGITSGRRLHGYYDYFDLPAMDGDGWDASVWAAAGLTTCGEMLLKLCVHSVE